jgi:putative FmdB family regulatory protein
MMPLVNFRCTACEEVFETLVRSSEEPDCPKCGSLKLERQISVLAPEMKSGAVIKAGRAQAAREGHLSNFNRSERGKK